jgi:predicted HicB family RNase H-like nuclease
MKTPAAKTKPVKGNFTIRIAPDVRAALDKAGETQGRPSANLAQWVIAEWLKSNGFLK